MTKAQKKAGNEVIAEFMNNSELIPDYWSLDKLDPVIDKIQSLGFTFVLGSRSDNDVNVIHAAYVDRQPPYNNTTVNKAKTRVEAVFTASMQFIESYESRPQSNQPAKKEVSMPAFNLGEENKSMLKHAKEE